ncbi:uncharacterized protein DMAD_01405 [Drosophila madeirensis]|uniref:Uncharacterized protein n=1 Tax=Drosophila madeirensis TaxID=30013 RepID=A0AAU9G205_DROMD
MTNTNQTACALQQNHIPSDRHSCRMHSKKPLPSLCCLLLPLVLCCASVEAFGNEYVHIKVHVPKEQAGEPEVAKVIHHYHHHPHPHQVQRLQRGRVAPPKPKHPSPLLESVILSDLDKPLHMSEHADYLNHAKELAAHLTESFNKKPPPLPPKKKVNTYTIIEEQHGSRPAPAAAAAAAVHGGYDYEDHPEHSVETYRVIESRPAPLNHHSHHHHKPHHDHHHVEEDDDEDLGYHYQPHHSHNHIGGAYAEPAPVEEHIEQEAELGYSYSAPYTQAGRGAKSGRAPSYTLQAPEEPSSAYGYDYARPSSSGSIGSSTGFRPSPQLTGYEDELSDAYGPPAAATRRRRPALVDWPEATGFNSAAAETYNGVDSYNVGHVQGYGGGGYQYSGPYL